jgi:hypothetical protein
VVAVAGRRRQEQPIGAGSVGHEARPPAHPQALRRLLDPERRRDLLAGRQGDRDDPLARRHEAQQPVPALVRRQQVQGPDA